MYGRDPRGELWCPSAISSKQRLFGARPGKGLERSCSGAAVSATRSVTLPRVLVGVFL